MERPSVIRKTAADLRLPPNLADYAAARASFRWPAVGSELQGLPGGGLNIAHETVERHARGPLRDRTAFRFLGANASRDITYGELSRLTNRFASVLKSLGIG